MYSILRSNETVFVGGEFGSMNGQARSRLAALDADSGELAPQVSPSSNGFVYTLLEHDGAVYLGGSFSQIGGIPRANLAAIDATSGTLLPFRADTDARVSTLATSQDLLFVGGMFSTIQGVSRARLAAVDLTDHTITPFAPAPDNNVDAIAVSADSPDTVYVAGSLTTIGGLARRGIAALSVSLAGSAIASFDAQSDNLIQALAISGSSMYVSGHFTSIGGQTRRYAARLDRGTGAALAFDPSQLVNTISTNASGVFLGGQTLQVDRISQANIAVIDLATNELAAMQLQANGAVYALHQSGDTLYVGGAFTTLNGVTRRAIGAIDLTTSSLTAFAPNASVGAIVRAITTDSTFVYAAGTFTTIGGQSRTNVAKLAAPNGSAITSFNASTVDGDVYALALTSDGATLYAGGDFVNIGGAARSRLAALTAADGTARAGFTADADARVRALALSGSSLMLGGSFNTINGSAARGLAVVDAPTGAHQPFVATSGAVNTLTIHGSTLYVGGFFSTIGGVSRRAAAAIDVGAPGGSVLPWRVPVGSIPTVNTISVSTSRIIVGGTFNTVGDEPQSFFGIFRNDNEQDDRAPLAFDGSVGQHVAPYQTTIWWKTSASASSELVWDTVSRSTWSEYRRDVSNTARDLGTIHSRTIANLPAGRYYYRVRSRDATGGQVTSPERTFDVTSPDAATPIGSTVTDGVVASTAFSPDGSKMYLAGWFTMVGERSGSGVTLNTSDGSMRPGTPQVAGGVGQSVAAPDGGYYISGQFSAIGGLPRTYLARLLPDGGVDPYFAPTVDVVAGYAHVLKLAISPDGTSLMLFGESLAGVNGSSVAHLAALDARTGATLPFDARADDDVDEVLFVDGGSAMLVWGSFGTIGGATRARLAKLDVATGDATSFAPNPSGQVGSVTPSADGAWLYVTGWFGTIGGRSQQYVAKLDAGTGAAASTFAPTLSGPYADARGAALSPDGATLYVVGQFVSANGSARQGVAAFATSDGSLRSFDGQVNSNVYGVVATGTGVFITGYFTQAGGRAEKYVAKLDLVTGDATSFRGRVVDDRGWNHVEVAVDATGTRVLARGSFNGIGGQDARSIALLDAMSGDAVAVPVVASSEYEVPALAFAQHGDTFFVGGRFQLARGTPRSNLAELDTATGHPTSLAPVIDDSVGSIALNGDGTRLYLAGDFTTIDGQPRGSIAELDIPSGTVTAFAPTVDQNAARVKFDATGRMLYVLGDFTSVNSQPRDRIARFDMTDGSLTGFRPDPDDDVYDIAVDAARGLVYVAGEFENVGGRSRHALAALSIGTGTATAFDAAVDAAGMVAAIALNADGSSLTIGGGFEAVGGQPRNSVAEVRTSDGSVTEYAAALNGPNYVMSLARRESDSSVFIAGGLGYDAARSAYENVAMQLDANGTQTGASYSSVGYFTGYGTSVSISRSLLLVGGAQLDSIGGVPTGGFALFDTCERSGFCGSEALGEYVTVEAVAGSVSLPPAPPGVSSTATSTIRVRSNSTTGYALFSTDTNDSSALTCGTGACAGTSILDWTGTDAAPATWAAADTGAGYGFGVTVLSSRNGRVLGKWGTGTAPTDFAENRYAGLRATTSTMLHKLPRFVDDAADDTILGWRLRSNPTQRVGSYSGVATILAAPNP